MKTFDWGSWVPKHGPAQAWPIAEKVAKELREKHGAKKVAAIGYWYCNCTNCSHQPFSNLCFSWGACVVVRLAATDLIEAAAFAHPSLLQVPADIEKITKV